MFNPKINNVMKKILFALATTALCFSCAKDQTRDLAPTAPDRLSVSFADETKIQLNDAMQTVWNADDRVSVFYYADANDRWRFTGNTGDKSGDLVREMQNSATATIDKAVIVYPYSADYTLDVAKQTISANIPAVQYYASDSYGIGSNIMVSTGTSNSFVLKSLCGWLKLQLSGTKTVSSIALKGNNGERLSGRAVIDYNTPCLVMGYGSSLDESEVGGTLVFDEERVLTLDCGSGVALSETPTAFYFSLAPQTFADGITMTVTYSDGTTFEKSTTNAISITRNHITPMAQLADEDKFTLSLLYANVKDMSATLAVLPRNDTDTYYCGLLTASKYNAIGGDTKIVDYCLKYILNALSNDYNLTYSNFLHSGSYSTAAKNLVPNTEYVFFAFGLNSGGSATSSLERVYFTTEPFSPTDYCSFALSTTAVTASSMDIKIEPSVQDTSQDTRYYLNVLRANKFQGLSSDEIAADCIDMGNSYNENTGYTWENSPRVFTGTQVINTEDFYEGGQLLADTEYLIVVFGVDNNGKRTTNVATLTQTTASSVPSDMTIDIDVTSITVDGATIIYMPSSQNERYFCNLLYYDDYVKYFNGNADAILNQYAHTSGIWSGYIKQGDYEDDSWAHRLPSGTKYIALAFGFDGGATTPLFTKEFTTEPAPAGNGIVLNYEIEDGALYGDDYKDYAIVGIYMTPYADTANWYYGTSSTSLDNFSDADLTDALLNNGGQNQTQRFYAWNWGETLYYATLAIDKDGNAGVPQRYAIAVPQKTAAATQSAVPSLSSVKRLNMTATVLTPKPEILLPNRDALHRLK